MSVRTQDILFRAGGATLKRLQSLVSGGASRVEVAHTFTRATVKRAFRDRDGTGKQAAAGNLAFDWPTGLVDASGAAIGGPLSVGTRTQLVTDPENFGAWTSVGTPVLTAGQTDPFGSTGAYLIGDDTAGATEGKVQTVTFTGDGTKAISLFMKQGLTPPATGNFVIIQDNTAVVERMRATITWTAGVPSAAMSFGGVQLVTPELWGNGWYRFYWQATAIVAANANQFRCMPASTAGIGDAYFFGAQAWNAPFPSNYQAPGESAGVADALTSPFNFGPLPEMTVLVRLGRPLHADAGAATALGVSPGIFSFGAGAAPRIGAYFDPAARNIIGVIDTATTDATVSAAIPAGHPTVLFQFKNLTTGGQVAIDTGSGLSAFSSAATAFSAFSSQTARIGRYDDELFGVVGDMIVARGLQTRADMILIP